MQRSIATASERPVPARAAAGLAGSLRRALAGADATWIGLAFVVLALGVYILSNPERRNFYNHFVWQAEAFLHGRLLITYPVTTGAVQNGYFQDILPLADQPGFALLPFAPLPALVLLPFVALFGLSTDAALISAVLGATNVGLAWRLCERLTHDRLTAVLATAFYGFGTVAWYAAMLGSTWFLAHVVASTFLLLAMTLALDGERREAARAQLEKGLAGGRRRLAGLRRWVDPLQFGAGLLFGLSALAREETILAAPFFVLVGGGGSLRRRAISAGLGASLMLLVLLAYNVISSGQLMNPVYQHLYQNEYVPRPELRHLDWNRIDPRYAIQNVVIMLGWPPEVRPECGLSLLDQQCPLVKPDPLGMSLLLTSPAYLLALPILRREWRRRLVLAATLATAAIALLLLMHFSQGWVQFGYRFSNSFAPFGLVLVTLGIARLGVRPLTVGLVAASILINAWGVWWGVRLGW